MTTSMQNDGAAFNSESISRAELASISALIADRDAHMEKAAQLARKVFVQVVSFDEHDKGDPTHLLTHTSSEALATEDEFALARMCIRNMRELKAELKKGMEAQIEISCLDKGDLECPNLYPDDQIEMGKKLLVACSLHLILDDHEKTDSTTDYAQAMISQSWQDSKIGDLFWGIARNSVRLLRECLTQFINACELQEANKDKKID